MKIAGITRIRNEQDIIKNTLDHVSKLVDAIYVYDDCSADNTVSVCENHFAVKKVFKGQIWQSSPKERNKAEGTLRQIVYQEVVKDGYDWVYYFDADEYIEFIDINFNAGAYYFRLFDFYITEEDKDENYLERKWMGPEYRDIPMLFKVNEHLRFTQRIPKGIEKPILFGGYVKHYGKAMSVKEWEETCDYYVNNRWGKSHIKLKNRWEERKGKAIHTVSDFGRPLINWEEREERKKIINMKKI